MSKQSNIEVHYIKQGDELRNQSIDRRADGSIYINPYQKYESPSDTSLNYISEGGVRSTRDVARPIRGEVRSMRSGFKSYYDNVIYIPLYLIIIFY